MTQSTFFQYLNILKASLELNKFQNTKRMKNFFIICINVLYSFIVYSQGNTKITIKIPQPDSTTLNAQILIEDPLQPINSGYYRDTVKIENGSCEFTFDIVNPSLMTLFVNDKYLTMPGVYSLIIEPKDNLVFDVPALEAGHYGFGITNVGISGKGSTKLNMTKDMVLGCLDIYRSDPSYLAQSLTFKFQTTDKKLNIIDSMYKINTSVSVKVKDLIKAHLYAQLLEPLFRSCNRSESDSVRPLLDKYIVEKKRLEFFYKKNVVKYAGTIGSYLVLTEFKNPVKVGGEFYQKRHKIEYAELLVRRLSKFPEIRDYLLSNHVITSVLKGLDTTSTELYKFYLENADFNNPNYTTVIKTYDEIEKKFAVGRPFYDFALPDNKGRIFTLSDFKGKIIVFDFWFNGCGGCRTMVPALSEAEKELKDKGVQFVSIGVDPKDLWLAGIGKYSSSNSLQLYTEGQADKHPMMQYLNLYSYPRLIIVDKNGKILPAPPDPRSNLKQFVQLIQSYL